MPRGTLPSEADLSLNLPILLFSFGATTLAGLLFGCAPAWYATRIDPGETPLEAAGRELQEEAGFAARKLTLLATLSLLPAYMTHKAQVILAEDLYPQRRPGDEPEPLEVVPWKLSELHLLLARDDVSEGRSIAALFIAREYLEGRFRPPT